MTKKDNDPLITIPREEYKKLLAQAGKTGKQTSSSLPAIIPATTSTGRRKKSEKRQRTKCLPVRLSPAEHFYLKQVAASSGLKMGAYIRQSVFGGAGERSQRAPSPDKEALALLLAHVGKVGGNINQLAKRANTDGFGAISKAEFYDMKAHVAAMRAMLMTALKPAEKS